MKFLVDECLSPKLTELAHEKGYGESSHVVWLGRSGAKDWDLLPLIIDGDWTFVTRNSIDFRGAASRPGEKGQYARVDLHAGLVCLNGPDTMTRSLQLEIFQHTVGAAVVLRVIHQGRRCKPLRTRPSACEKLAKKSIFSITRITS